MHKYRMEIPAVRQSVEKLGERLERFADRYRRTVAAGHVVSLTDNAMGNLAFQGHELIRELQLPVPSGQVMIHINTFHALKELHVIIDACAELQIGELLVISGDGSVRLPKLKNAELDSVAAGVTSVELLSYLRRHYGKIFRYGVAFNQYEPAAHEEEKLRRKLDAGAEFVITQPVLKANLRIGELLRTLPVPLYLEAWMSPKIDLLRQCIGYEIAVAAPYEPLAALRQLQEDYPNCPVYLAMVDFNSQFDRLIRPTEAVG